ncbi:MAG: hypothetical protein IPK00_10200 [Deltaproteobacteria bacterium]|nr:hypothetical protein [Deltaproteobacteria bacterium]
MGISTPASRSACSRGGKSCRDQTADRGRILRIELATGEVERVASGFRTPNGLAATPTGALLVTDNQGAWLPASKLIRIEAGADYGWRPPGEVPDPARVTPPTLWLPQNEIGNSPTQPVVPTADLYAGHVLFGDVFNGGLKAGRARRGRRRLAGGGVPFLGRARGAGESAGGGAGRSLVAGEIGSPGNWGEYGKPWYGLERLAFGDEAAFEPMRVAPGQAASTSSSRGRSRRASPRSGAVPGSRTGTTCRRRATAGRNTTRALVVSAVRTSADRRVVSPRRRGARGGAGRPSPPRPGDPVGARGNALGSTRPGTR